MTATTAPERVTPASTRTPNQSKIKAPTLAISRAKQEARNGRCDFCLQRGGAQALDLGGYRMVACSDCTAAIERHDVSTLVERAMQGNRITEASHPGSIRRLTEDYGYLVRSERKSAGV